MLSSPLKNLLLNSGNYYTGKDISSITTASNSFTVTPYSGYLHLVSNGVAGRSVFLALSETIPVGTEVTIAIKWRGETSEANGIRALLYDTNSGGIISGLTSSRLNLTSEFKTVSYTATITNVDVNYLAFTQSDLPTSGNYIDIELALVCIGSAALPLLWTPAPENEKAFSDRLSKAESTLVALGGSI